MKETQAWFLFQTNSKSLPYNNIKPSNPINKPFIINHFNLASFFLDKNISYKRSIRIWICNKAGGGPGRCKCIRPFLKRFWSSSRWLLSWKYILTVLIRSVYLHSIESKYHVYFLMCSLFLTHPLHWETRHKMKSSVCGLEGRVSKFVLMVIYTTGYGVFFLQYTCITWA